MDELSYFKEEFSDLSLPLPRKQTKNNIFSLYLKIKKIPKDLRLLT